MATIFYLYDCISFNDLIRHIKENKGMVPMMLVYVPLIAQVIRIWGFYLSFTGGVALYCITEAFSLLKEVPSLECII